MDTLIKDIRYAARKLIRTPAFTIVAVATLALAIGATTATFSVLNAVLFRPLPFSNTESLVQVSSWVKGKTAPMSALDFMDYRDQTRTFVGMAPTDNNNVNLTGDALKPQRLSEAAVGARFFELLGVNIPLGRGFAAGEDGASAAKVAVLSDGLWRSRFGSDPKIIGRRISIDGNPYTVVGVAAPRFDFPRQADLWVPMKWETWQLDPENRGAHSMMAIGRLKPGVTVEAGKKDVAAVARRLAVKYPKSNTNFEGTALRLDETILGNVRLALFSMLGAVAFVLLIACANIANLLLVRAAAHQGEMTIRTALGASRSRLIRQSITESVLLSLVGAAAGTTIAAWAVSAVVAWGPSTLPRLQEVSIDWRVLVFSAAVGIVAGILFGLAPAMFAARSNVGQMLRQNTRGTTHGGLHATRRALITAEIALAVVLLMGAGLLIRSFVRLTSVDPGFRAEHVTTFSLTLPQVKYEQEPQVRAFTTQLLEKFEQLPGTRAAGVVFGRPFEPQRMRTSFEVRGWPESTPDNRRLSEVRPASPGFFKALGIPLVRGRLYTAEEDRPDRAPVVVVNQEFVRRYFKNEDPIGKHITLGIRHTPNPGDTVGVDAGGEIIGVVGNVKQMTLSEEPIAATYVPWGQLPINDVSVVVNSTAEPKAVEGAVNAQVRSVDAEVPVYGLSTMENLVSSSVTQPRFYMALLAVFAGIALVLAGLGIYGVISYAVSQRTREMGIRIALGATRGGIARLIVGQGMWPVISGIVAGLCAAAWLTRVIASMLFGVAPLDPATIAFVPVVLAAVAIFAAWLPARRAGRIDPIIAMRSE
jgi:putative ABC transport system permease protein